METVVRSTTSTETESPDPSQADWLAEAVERLAAGDVVAFPTETVYGLGANALDASAVARIFEAKGRPSTNPLIVHVGSIEHARQLVRDWPASADRLATRFWPGPLSLVLPKAACVPDIVTAGGSTVAVRVPAHPVALALVRSAGMPLAAPSANRSNSTSPTRAEHVLRSLNGRIGLILDGGSCSGGLESTVVDLSTSPPRVLRLGLVSVEELSDALGEPVLGPLAATEPKSTAEPARSPGQLTRHYAPDAPLWIVSADRIADRVRSAIAHGQPVGLLIRECDFHGDLGPLCVLECMPNDPSGYAAELYAALHRLDQAEVKSIVAAAPPEIESWAAVWDRLRRASTPSTD
jgi:L-threonylcarbamoyladenylate synthase